jgi:hypothetical protein
MRRTMDAHPRDLRNGGRSFGDTDQLNSVPSLDEAQFNGLVQRLENTRTAEQLIYREAELDETWRLVDGARRDVAKHSGSTELADVLQALLQAVHKVHDLVGDDDDAASAANELRRSVFLVRKYTTLISR